jgi:hypothetical protein
MLQCWSCKVKVDEETGYHLVDGAATCSDCED